jgi:prepilin-type N-terminal cleavage/methylation domain-containing protein
MLSPSRQFRPARCIPSLARTRTGFTLVEIVIALAVLGVMSAGVYLGFNGVNTYAVSSRLYSEAQTAAQNQIDLVLSREPFDCSTSGAYISGLFDPSLNKIPVELMTIAELDILANGVTFPTTAPTAPPATTSPYYPYYPYYRESAGQPLKKEAFIYQDPVTGAVVVSGTLTTTVTDTALTMNFVNTGTNLNTRKANVTVTYNFRGRPYTLSMDTLRTSNQ